MPLTPRSTPYPHFDINDNCICLTNGTQLGYASYGQANGIPAFYFHGLPGSRREGVLLDQACLDAGVQLISPDRPGYGLSKPIPDFRLVQWPHLIAELADQLGFTKFYLFASSGGAPYALACASVLHQRVTGTGICCGLAEVAQADLRVLMSGFARLGFWLARRHPTLLNCSYGLLVTAAAKVMPRLSIGLLARLQGQPDLSVLRRPEIRAIFTENLREAFRQGPAGGLADMCVAIHPWPFDPSGIESLQLWYGTQDRVVPLQQGEWLARIIPTAKLHIIQDEGHFSLPIRYAAKVVATVVTRETQTLN